MVQLLGFLATPLGWAMRWMYNLIGNYGWVIIISTVVLRILMFPLSMKQQKSQARMSAYQPMIQEIQKKWANDRNRANEEVMKFQEENGIKMSAGCAPMLVNMIVLFSMIVVIQAPLTHMMDSTVVTEADITSGVAIVQKYDPDSSISTNTFTQQSILIGEITGELSGDMPQAEREQMFIEGYEETITLDDGTTENRRVKMSPESIEAIKEFQFNFAGLNLAMVPSFSNFVSLILPILSVLTMFGSQVLTMLTSGQRSAGGSMWMMTIVMGLFFGWYAFTVPVGFSLYYAASNIVMALQQLLLKRIYNPEKIKEEVIQEIEERKKSKKAKKKVTIVDDSGNKVEKELSEAELAKIRLAKARELDAQRYGSGSDEDENLEKAREQDEEKYGGSSAASKEEGAVEVLSETVEDAAEAGPSEEAEKVENTAEIPEKPQAPQKPEAPSAPAKPGRRKRATDKKKATDPSDETTDDAPNA